MKEVEERSESFEKQLKQVFKNFKNISEAVGKEATETVVRIISKQQDESEKRSEALFDSHNQQLSMITKYLKPQAPSKSTNVQQPSQPQHSYRQPQHGNYQHSFASDAEQPSAVFSSRNTAKQSCTE